MLYSTFHANLFIIIKFGCFIFTMLSCTVYRVNTQWIIKHVCRMDVWVAYLVLHTPQEDNPDKFMKIALETSFSIGNSFCVVKHITYSDAVFYATLQRQ